MQFLDLGLVGFSEIISKTTCYSAFIFLSGIGGFMALDNVKNYSRSNTSDLLFVICSSIKLYTQNIYSLQSIHMPTLFCIITENKQRCLSSLYFMTDLAFKCSMTLLLLKWFTCQSPMKQKPFSLSLVVALLNTHVYFLKHFT